MLTCEKCGASRSQLDNYCRNCGAAFTVSELPPGGDWQLVKLPGNLPIKWVPVRPQLWQGLAALAAGAALELLRREINRRLSTQLARPENAPQGEPRSLVVRRQELAEPPAEFEVREAFFFRQIIRRR